MDAPKRDISAQIGQPHPRADALKLQDYPESIFHLITGNGSPPLRFLLSNTRSGNLDNSGSCPDISSPRNDDIPFPPYPY